MISDLIAVSVQWLDAVASWLCAEPILLLFSLTCLLYVVKAVRILIGR